MTNLPLAVQTDNYSFAGDGSTKNYVLSQSYASSSVSVFVAGIAYTNVTDYIISGPSASFVTAPPSGSNILIKALLNTANATGTFSGSFIGTATLTGSTTINNTTYIWPSVQGAANTVLTNDGTGTLTWAASGGSTKNPPIVNVQQAQIFGGF